MGTQNFDITEVQQADANKETILNQEIVDVINAVSEPVTVNFASDADKTVTAADVAKYLALNVTGTITVMRNLIVPTSNKKVYLVKNSTTGGFSITVKTSAGSGILIHNGEEALVRCDGTNVVRADVACAPSVLLFGGSALTTSVGTSYFAWPGWHNATLDTTERTIRMPFAGVMKELQVQAETAPAGGAVRVTVRKNAADSALTCDLAAAATQQADSVHAFTFAKGDRISVKIVEQAGYSGSLANLQVTMAAVQEG